MLKGREARLPLSAGGLSVLGATNYRKDMPAGKASMDGQVHDLYARAESARKQARLLVRELQATRRKTRENWQLVQAAWEETERIRARRVAADTDPDRLRHSPYARLQARLASLPVIEQAKGIIMAQYGWSEDQAFETLRRASQRENVKVRDLAASIVARTARSAPAQRRQAGAASTAVQSGGKFIRGVDSSGSQDRYRASA
jgi:hypothetical protein